MHIMLRHFQCELPRGKRVVLREQIEALGSPSIDSNHSLWRSLILTFMSYIVDFLVLSIRDVNTVFLANRFFGYLKPVLNRISVLLTFIKIYYYTKKITVCITCCNVNTLKAVSTPVCSRFSLKPKWSNEHSLYCLFYN